MQQVTHHILGWNKLPSPVAEKYSASTLHVNWLCMEFNPQQWGLQASAQPYPGQAVLTPWQHSTQSMFTTFKVALQEVFPSVALGLHGSASLLFYSRWKLPRCLGT